MYGREVKETGAYVFNRSSPGGLNLSGINGMSHICLRMSRFSFCMLRVFVLEREVALMLLDEAQLKTFIYVLTLHLIPHVAHLHAEVSRVESSTLHGLGKHNHFGLIWISACFALKPIYMCVCLLTLSGIHLFHSFLFVLFS